MDLRGFTDIDTLAEKVMLSIVDALTYRVTFTHLEKWVQKQYSNTLIILDNCDELLESHKEEFLDDIKLLVGFSRKHVKYLLTSQKWVADIGNFQLHAIYNLSSEASMQLLGRVAPSLTDDQKIDIAKLTGNVPLALEVIGAIFKFPNAPTAGDVIQGLRENPVDTLSPSKLHSTVDVSIGLAYRYLTPELKQLCVNLSYFPGTFNKQSAYAIFGDNLSVVIGIDELMQRSLLQFNPTTKRYHFHQLIQAYFLQITYRRREESMLQHFHSAFQLYFAFILNSITDDYDKALTTLDEEKHNLQYMFTLFATAKHVNNTFFGVKQALYAIQLRVLQLRFTTKEIHNISWSMLTALESYTPYEEASVKSFLIIYSGVVMLVAEQQSPNRAIEILTSNSLRINSGYEGGIISMNTFTKFYALLAQYYREEGEDRMAIKCHAHILRTTRGELKHCYPECDYLSISKAYEKTGEKVKAFHFRELAHEHQLASLSKMEQAKLILDLYNDYSSASLGNMESKANTLSSVIITDVYQYLMNASESEFVTETYYIAVEFFTSRDLEEHVVHLQQKMLTAVQGDQCILEKCERVGDRPATIAMNRKCYHLAIGLGKRAFYILEKASHPEQWQLMLKAELARIVGFSYYYIGSYTESRVWITRALQHLNVQVKATQCTLRQRFERLPFCFYLIVSGDITNVFCYGYIIKDFMIMMTVDIIEGMQSEYTSEHSSKTQPERSTDMAISEQKYMYHNIWINVNKIVGEKNLLYAEWLIFEIPKAIITLLIIIIIVVVILFVCLMICCGVRKACRSPVCWFICLVILLFVLGLDWLY